MSIEQAIHERWAAYRPLTDLVPANRIYTGRIPARDASGKPLELPYVSLSGQRDLAVTRTSSGVTLRSSILRFELYAESHESAQQIAATIEGRFNRAETSYEDGRVLDMKRLDRRVTQEPDGVWRITLDFQTRDAREAAA